MGPFSEALQLASHRETELDDSRTVRWHLEKSQQPLRHVKHSTFRSMGIHTGYHLRPERHDSFSSFLLRSSTCEDPHLSGTAYACVLRSDR